MDYKNRIDTFIHHPEMISEYEILFPGELEYINYIGYSSKLHPAVITIDILKEMPDYEKYIRKHTQYIKEHRSDIVELFVENNPIMKMHFSRIYQSQK